MRYLLLIIALISAAAQGEAVKDNPCKVPQSSIGIGMMEAMAQDMRIDTSTIDQSKTTTELVANNLVDSALAAQFGQEDYQEAADNWLSLQRYKEINSENHARNLIIKFTYKNKDKYKNIFLVSALVDDYECSIRFNGYITLQREF